ncbi:prepilin-type N-terminal cleavage/methylation domain-containing protein [Bremerella sp. JC817]|uniref:PulJ/GspJ family protein n=1 Tax=Bremerella sp. JC817 TaxID=3231756 RepID=UPI00345B278D
MWNTPKPLSAMKARGLTLVEMLMATALTLIMFAAVAQIFGMMGASMRDARATIELSGNLRTVANTLQQDLDNISVDVLPWVQPGANQGYFEIIEGPDREVDFATLSVVPAVTDSGSMCGDADDIICFTAYSKDQPFTGRVYGTLATRPAANITPDRPEKFYIDTSSGNFSTIESHYAEVVYFTKLTPADDRNLEATDTVDYRDATETVTLYRRVFLIRPDILIGDSTGFSGLQTSNALSNAEARNYYDLSLRNGTGANNRWQTNSLEDLQSRENRIGRAFVGPSTPPHIFQPATLLTFEQLNGSLGAGNLLNRTGEDVILAKTLAFDVKVYDPRAVVLEELSAGTIAITPNDIGYDGTDATNYSTVDYMTGTFVDLNWQSRANAVAGSGSVLGGIPTTKSMLNNIEVNSASLYGTAPTTFADLQTSFPGIPSRLTPATPGVPAAAGTGPDLTLTYAYYDTWPFLYEMDGIDQDGDGVVDEGTNGFDDDGDGVVDDKYATDLNGDGDTLDAGEASELETSPPYTVPLRGVSVMIRAIEPATRQVRQDTVVADFIPE